MNLPRGYTEQQVLEAIEVVVNSLAPSFVFGFYDLEDVRQELPPPGVQPFRLSSEEAR